MTSASSGISARACLFLAQRPPNSKRPRPLPQNPPIPTLRRRYLGLLPVHALWRAYAERLAARDPGVTLEAYRDRLLGAELHGALVRVKACAARPDAAGLTGIVALSRPHSLVLVTPGDRRIRIPRQNSTLELLMGTRLVALEYGEDVVQG